MENGYLVQNYKNENTNDSTMNDDKKNKRQDNKKYIKCNKCKQDVESVYNNQQQKKIYYLCM